MADLVLTFFYIYACL